MNDGYTKVTLATIVAIVLISVVAMLLVDPRTGAMKDCVGIGASEQHKLECAKAIFGEDK